MSTVCESPNYSRRKQARNADRRGCRCPNQSYNAATVAAIGVLFVKFPPFLPNTLRETPTGSKTADAPHSARPAMRPCECAGAPDAIGALLKLAEPNAFVR